MDKKAIYSSILEFCISTFKPCFLNSNINKFLYFVCVLLRGQGEGVNLDGRRPLNKPVIFIDVPLINLSYSMSYPIILQKLH